MIPPSFKQSLKAVQVDMGQNAVLHCHITGKPMPSIAWYHNDQKIKLNDRVQLKFGRESGKWELHIINTIPDDTGVFRCVASNPRGEASCEANVVVVGMLRHAVGDASKIQYMSEEDLTQELMQLEKPVYVFKEPATITETIVSTADEFTKKNEEIDEFAKLQVDSKFKREFNVEENTTTETKVRSERERAIEHFDGQKSYKKDVWEQAMTTEETEEPNLTGEVGEEGDLVMPIEGEDPVDISGMLVIAGRDGQQQKIDMTEIDINKLAQKDFPKEGKLSHATRDVKTATKQAETKGAVMTRIGKDGKTEVAEMLATSATESGSKTVTKTMQKDVQWKTSDKTEVRELTESEIRALVGKPAIEGGEVQEAPAPQVADTVHIPVKHEKGSKKPPQAPPKRERRPQPTQPEQMDEELIAPEQIKRKPRPPPPVSDMSVDDHVVIQAAPNVESAPPEPKQEAVVEDMVQPEMKKPVHTQPKVQAPTGQKQQTHVIPVAGSPPRAGGDTTGAMVTEQKVVASKHESVAKLSSQETVVNEQVNVKLPPPHGISPVAVVTTVAGIGPDSRSGTKSSLAVASAESKVTSLTSTSSQQQSQSHEVSGAETTHIVKNVTSKVTKQEIPFLITTVAGIGPSSNPALMSGSGGDGSTSVSTVTNVTHGDPSTTVKKVVGPDGSVSETRTTRTVTKKTVVTSSSESSTLPVVMGTVEMAPEINLEYTEKITGGTQSQTVVQQGQGHTELTMTVAGISPGPLNGPKT